MSARLHPTRTQFSLVFWSATISVLLVGYASQAQTLTSEAVGLVVPARAWDVSAEQSNKISRIFFIEGQMVSEGDLLVQFDTGFKALELELAEARLAQAVVVVEEAALTLERQEELQTKDAVSEVAFQDALFAYRRAEAERNTLEIQRNMAALIVEAQSLYAPFDGQISAPNYRDNANVNIDDSREIATIVQLDPIHVRATVALERVLFRMREGRDEAEIADEITVELTLPDGTAYEHSGRPLTASYDLDPASDAVVVIVEFPNPDRLLRPGMTVQLIGWQN